MVERLVALARAATTDVPEIAVELHVTRVEASLAGVPGVSAQVHHRWMNRLEARRYERARGALPWDVLVPTGRS